MKFAFLFLLLISSQVWGKWTVSTYNIRNFDKDPGSGRTNLLELEKIIQSVKSDVMAFEEVVNVKAFKDLMNKALPSYGVRFSNCGGFGKQNLAIVYNPKVFKFVSQQEDMTFSGNQGSSCGSLRPVLLVTLQKIVGGEDHTFGVVHLKAGGDANAFNQRWKQYQLLGSLAKKFEDKNLILLGDFNTTGYNIKDKDFMKFQDFLNSASLSTVAEDIACTNYWSGNDEDPSYLPSILDHIVLPSKIAPSVQSVNVGAHCKATQCEIAQEDDLGVSFASVSDHCPVQVVFE